MKLTDEKKILSLDGLMSRERQSKLLGIKKTIINDFWRRHCTRIPGFVNGLDFKDIKKIAPLCPYLYTDFNGRMNLCLWVDIAKLNIETNEIMKKSIQVMAQFQCWIHEENEKNVRDKICKIMAEGYLQK